jgi:hypothetical protein
MQSTMLHETQHHIKENWVDSNEDFAIRENFTLFYHNWPFNWDKNDNCVNLDLELLITDPFKSIVQLLEKLKMQVVNSHGLKKILRKWVQKNLPYFQIYYDCKKINNALDNNQNMDLTHITSLHDQGYINYWVEQKYNITIPAYDYKFWFKNIIELQTALKLNEKNNFNNQ